MEEWKEYKLRDLVVTINRGITPEYVETNGYYVINQKCIRNNFLSFSEARLTNKSKRITPYKKVNVGDILVNSTGTGTLGRTAFVKKLPDEITTVDTHVTIVRPNNLVDRKYLAYNLGFQEPQIENYAKGATNQQELGRDDLGLLKIYLPPLPTQRKIAKILSTYDDLIENNLKRIKLLEEMAQRTYEEWFVRFKFPGHENAKFDKETDLPGGWKRMKLGDVTSYINRGIAPKYVKNSGIIVINQKCIRDNKVNLNLSRFSDSEKKISNEKYLKPFDILVNSTGTGTLGRVAQILNFNGLITVDTHVTIVRAKNNFSKIYLGRAIEYQEKSITNLGKGATNQIELSRSDLSELIEIVVPNNNLLERFDIIFKSNYEVIHNLIIENQRLKEARDILLPRLMTGMVDVDKIEMN